MFRSYLLKLFFYCNLRITKSCENVHNTYVMNKLMVNILLIPK